jgi:hypothetical protein
MKAVEFRLTQALLKLYLVARHRETPSSQLLGRFKHTVRWLSKVRNQERFLLLCSRKEALFFFRKLISFVLINGQTSIDVWPFSVGSFAFALFRIDAAACHG